MLLNKKDIDSIFKYSKVPHFYQSESLRTWILYKRILNQLWQMDLPIIINWEKV